jgi:TolA-binding protein
MRSAVLCLFIVAGVAMARHTEFFLNGFRTLDAPGTRHVRPETLLRQIEVAAGENRQAEVAQLCEQLFTQHPDHPLSEPAYLRAMRARIEAGDYVSACQDFERFRSRCAQSKLLPEAMLDVAGWQYEAGEFDKAARTYTDLIALVTRNASTLADSEDTTPELPMWRSLRSWNEHRREERGRAQLERLARFNQALCYERSGDRDAALRAYDRFLCRFPEDSRAAEAHFQMAVLQEQDGNSTEALRHFESVYAAGDSSEAPAALRLESVYRAGRVYEALHRYEEATTTYHLALPLRPVENEYRLASMAELAHLIEAREPLRALDIYHEIAERSMQPSWRAVALERMTALESEAAVAAASR